MKWKITLLTLCLALTIVFALSAEEDLWGLGNLTVLTFRGGGSAVSGTVENSAVQLRFDRWNEKTEKELRNSLIKSPLSFRLFPSRQATMMVEIYSPSSDVNYSAKRQRDTLQLVVGERNPARAATDLLLSNQSDAAMPPKLVKDLKNGMLGKVRYSLLKEVHKKSDKDFLSRARVSVINVAIRSGRSAGCAEPPEDMPTTKASREGLFLAAWCLRASNKPNRALRYLKMIKEMSPGDAALSRIKRLETKIIFGSIFSADRQGKPMKVASIFLDNQDFILESNLGLSTLEIISSNLGRIGLGHLLTEITDRIVSGADEKKLRSMSAIIAETYYNAGQMIRASDAASYFLSKHQPDWLSGRLYRIRGRVALQEGDWSQAAADLERSRRLLLSWSIEDELALAEALTRMTSNKVKINLNAKGSTRGGFEKLSIGFEDWFDRVLTERNIMLGSLPTKKLMDRLPSFVLYRSAQAALEREDFTLAKKILEKTAQRKDGWGKMARLSLKIEETSMFLEMVKAGWSKGKLK